MYVLWFCTQTEVACPDICVVKGCGGVWWGVGGVVWGGVVWCGEEWWCGVVWCGVVWCGEMWWGVMHCAVWVEWCKAVCCVLCVWRGVMQCAVCVAWCNAVCCVCG